MPDKKMLVVGPTGMAVAYEATKQVVLINFDLPAKETGLVQGLLLGVALSPNEARQLAGMLNRKAADAEGADRPRVTMTSLSGDTIGVRRRFEAAVLQGELECQIAFQVTVSQSGLGSDDPAIEPEFRKVLAVLREVECLPEGEILPGSRRK